MVVPKICSSIFIASLHMHGPSACVNSPSVNCQCCKGKKEQSLFSVALWKFQMIRVKNDRDAKINFEGEHAKANILDHCETGPWYNFVF